MPLLRHYMMVIDAFRHDALYASQALSRRCDYAISRRHYAKHDIRFIYVAAADDMPPDAGDDALGVLPLMRHADADTHCHTYDSSPYRLTGDVYCPRLLTAYLPRMSF